MKILLKNFYLVLALAIHFAFRLSSYDNPRVETPVIEETEVQLIHDVEESADAGFAMLREV